MINTGRRRLPVFAVLGLLALAALAGCRADPAVAAYVDGVRITEAEIDQVIEGLRTEVGGAQPAGELEEQLAAVRPRVVEMRVLTEVATGYAARQGLEPPAPDREQVGTDLALSADGAYVAVVADFVAVMELLQGTVEPVPPTEADQREVYAHLVADNDLAVPFEEVRAELDERLLGRPVALRNLLTEAVAQADIQLNPRYDLVYQVPVQVGSTQTWLGVPLGDSAVVDAGSRS